MTALRDQPIRRKLLTIVVFVSVIALLISGLSFGAYQHYVIREKMVRDLAVTAAIIGDNSSAALAFNSDENARDILRSLDAQPHIIAACLYNTNGNVFASYERSRRDMFAFPPVEEPGQHFDKARLVLFRPIVADGQVAGTIFIASDLEELKNLMVRYGVTALLIHGLALAIIWPLASRLHRIIWHPLQQLAIAASTVAREKNYSLRVTRESNDELGNLIDQFNSMLGEIAKRDEALKQAREDLERRVEERTHELEAEITERRKAEEARRESEALYSSLVEHIPLAVYRKDILGRFTFANEAFCAAAGLTREKVIGSTDFDTTEPHFAEKYRRDDDRVMLRREKLAVEEKTVRATGEVRDIQVFKVPVLGSDGTVKGTQGCFFDVTEQKKMREALAYERDLLRTLLDNSPDHIYFKDVQSHFIKCSVALAKRLGLKSVDEIIGKTDADLFCGSHGADALKDEQTIIRTGVPIVGKVEHEIWSNGVESWVITTKVPYRDAEGRIIGTFGISKDITELKRAEQEVNALHTRLLDSSHKAGMAEVATGVLHNVGNVLNSINVSTTVLAEQIKHSRVANLSKAAALIQSNSPQIAEFFAQDPRGKQLPEYLSLLAEHLAGEQVSMMNEISQLARHVEHVKEIVSMQQTYAKVSGVNETLTPQDLVEDALRINTGALVRHDVKVIREFNPARRVLVDRHKVLQILINLISNAKYAMDAQQPDEKLLRIRIVQMDDAVHISVNDNGVGIPNENLSRIFEHGFTTRKDGHGFGLHSSALAATELGGSLSVKSAGRGAGATFTLELPNEPVTPNESVGQAADEEPSMATA